MPLLGTVAKLYHNMTGYNNRLINSIKRRAAATHGCRSRF